MSKLISFSWGHDFIVSAKQFTNVTWIDRINWCTQVKMQVNTLKSQPSSIWFLWLYKSIILCGFCTILSLHKHILSAWTWFNFNLSGKYICSFITELLQQYCNNQNSLKFKDQLCSIECHLKMSKMRNYKTTKAKEIFSCLLLFSKSMTGLSVNGDAEDDTNEQMW